MLVIPAWSQASFAAPLLSSLQCSLEQLCNNLCCTQPRSEAHLKIHGTKTMEIYPQEYLSVPFCHCLLPVGEVFFFVPSCIPSMIPLFYLLVYMLPICILVLVLIFLNMFYNVLRVSLLWTLIWQKGIIQILYDPFNWKC